jgi:antitoxin ParD1/3/4
MPTNIEIDDELMRAAMQAGGFTTENQTVEAGLKLLLRQQGYARLLELGGKLRWEDDSAEVSPKEAGNDSGR